MALYEIKDLSFSYEESGKLVLENINCHINKGDIAVICGPSSSGKTTLLRHLKKEVLPVGKLTGDIYYKGENIVKTNSNERVSQVGIVYQNPESQMVMDNVIHELAFSLENMGCMASEMMVKIGELVTYFGLEESLEKQVHELSGGQKQMINICAALILYPEVLILDEPTAQLDPVASKELIKMIVELNQELGITIIISEHRLDEVLQYADQIIYLEEGHILYDGGREKVLKKMSEGERANYFLPEISRLFHLDRRSNGNRPIPITVKEGRELAEEIMLDLCVSEKDKVEDDNQHHNQGDDGGLVNQVNRKEKKQAILINCKELYYMYNKEADLVLKGLDLQIRKGDFIGIIGGNGSGKTTLLKIMAKLLRPTRGKVLYENKGINQKKERDIRSKIGYVAQNTMLHITRESVLEELNGVKEKYHIGDNENWVLEIIKAFDLEPIYHRHPYDLSGGERQKLVIAMALLKRPSVLMLDEPIKGLDPYSKAQMASILKGLNKKGMTIIMVSHDVEFIAKHVGQCAMLFNGDVVYYGGTKTLLKSNYFYTTKINKVMKPICNDLITIEDVMKQCLKREY
jgi:energy-coupling factor transport system ATP-binding protein